MDRRSTYTYVKRLLDLIGSLTAIIVLSPLFLLTAIAVKLDSPGPVIFAQRRAGLNGKPFTMFKFRTMVADAEARLSQVLDIDALKEPVFKLKSDPRITRVGAFLRRTSLDELPQFFNVLLGDMSLVGPRPEEVWLVERYNEEQRARLRAKPGITGPMQIAGRGDLSLAERVSLDTNYIHNQSLWTDVRILLLTVPAVLLRRGAR